MNDLTTDARRRLALLAQREDIDAAIADIDARILAACQVGDHIDIDDETVFRVQQRRTFDLDQAQRVVPAQLIQAATVPTVDAKVLKSLHEAGQGVRGQGWFTVRMSRTVATVAP